MTLSLLALVAVAVSHVLPVGYQFDCRSWPGVVAAKVTVTLISTDGSTNRGMFDLAAGTEPKAAQLLLMLALEQDGWEIREGMGFTVVAFAPKGQSIKSVKFEANVWVPQYKRILALPPPKK